MRYETPLTFATLGRRYKRFLADVTLDDGRAVTVHCPNSGSMKGCAEPGSRVALSFHDKPTRRLKYTWELVDVGGWWVCVNTGLPNRIVAEAIAAGRIGSLRGYASIRPEVPYGKNSRIDLLLTGHRSAADCYVEVKNVTLRQGRAALFPDAVTTRGLKHLHELSAMVRAGARAAMVYLVNRGDCAHMGPARAIDPAYADAMAEARAAGVELLAYRTRVTPEEVVIEKKLPVRLG